MGRESDAGATREESYLDSAFGTAAAGARSSSARNVLLDRRSIVRRVEGVESLEHARRLAHHPCVVSEDDAVVVADAEAREVEEGDIELSARDGEGGGRRGGGGFARRRRRRSGKRAPLRAR